MDIAKTKETSKPGKQKKLIIAATLLAFFIAYQFVQPSNQQKAGRSDLLIDTVKRGDLKIEVEGYGVLRSDKQKLLTSLTSATVEEIILKPGAMVEADSVILRLSNPELLLEVERAEQSLNQQKANLRQLKLTNMRDLMAEDALLAELKGNHKATKMRRIAEQKLVAAGIISSLTFNTTKIAEEQMAERIELQNKRRAQLILVQQEALNIQQEQIKQAQGTFQSISNRVERLTVRAGLSGVLQGLPVELGQSVTAGQALALVGSINDMVALIRVPQTQAQRIKLGQPTVVDTRRDKINGKVVRIDPAVQEGTVTVEIAFSEALPASARPELNVDGTISTETISNAWYIKRPVNIGQNSKAKLYKLSAENDSASATELTFGAEAGRFIQIISGAKTGDSFILSDMGRYDAKNAITITQ